MLLSYSSYATFSTCIIYTASDYDSSKNDTYFWTLLNTTGASSGITTIDNTSDSKLSGKFTGSSSWATNVHYTMLVMRSK